MIRRIDQTNISDVRRVAKLMVEDEPVAGTAITAARDSFFAIRKEALEHGLTEADVIRAVLSPVFARKPKGCDCYTCKARRGEGQHVDAEENALHINA